VPLRPPPAAAGGVTDGAWTFDEAELRAAVTPRARLLLLNTPHNPTGKVFTRAELAVLADVADRGDLVVLTDEVYEHLVFRGAEHVSLATLPGMRDRTLVVGSGGKTFNTTGWKVGWICGPAPLVSAVRTAKQFLTYVNGGPFQPAIAAGLRLPDEFFTGVAARLQQRRDLLVTGLAEAGLPVLSPQATYFATVDVRPVQPVVFYDPADADLGRHLVRFAFCKQLEVLGEAVGRMRRMT
jgi:N-succinyldiaminopimelate aminotransferase